MAGIQYQVFNVEKSKTLLAAAEANENERRWDDRKIDEKNIQPENNYDRTRMHLNFEIGPDGKLHPLGYQSRTLDQRLKDRLEELNWKPFKEGSKNAPNIFVKMLFCGSPERMHELAYGSQEIDHEKGADNSDVVRQQQIEQWAMDIYKWLCRKYGKENIIGFQVHMDEKTPHVHALVISVGKRGKSQADHVMYSAHFGKHKSDFPKIMEQLHTALHEEVNSHYGLARGESCEGRDVHHMDKREAIRELKKMEKAINALRTMKSHFESDITTLKEQYNSIKQQIEEGKIDVAGGKLQLAAINEQLEKAEAKLQDKEDKLSAKTKEWNELTENLQGYHNINKPFPMPSFKISIPKIQGTPPINPLKHNDWVKEQNERIAKETKANVNQVLQDLKKIVDEHVVDSHKEIFRAYLKEQDNYFCAYDQYRIAEEESTKKDDVISQLISVIQQPKMSSTFLAVFDALVGGKPIPSSVGGGSDNSDLRWDGRNPDEEENAFRRRVALHALKFIFQMGKKRRGGYHR